VTDLRTESAGKFAKPKSGSGSEVGIDCGACCLGLRGADCGDLLPREPALRFGRVGREPGECCGEGTLEEGFTPKPNPETGGVTGVDNRWEGSKDLGASLCLFFFFPLRLEPGDTGA